MYNNLVKSCRTLLLVAGLLFPLSVLAIGEPAPADEAAAILKKLQAARPDFTYGEVKQSLVPGLYQVQVERGPLMYVVPNGDMVLIGDVFGVTEDGYVNLVDVALAPLRKERLAQVKDEDTIVFPAKGDTKAVINVFTDVDCPYCRRLHQHVEEINARGIEVRYLAYPLGGPGSPNHVKLAQAFCAKDRAATLTRLKNGEEVDTEFCQDNPVLQHYKLAGELEISATPTVIMPDGSRFNLMPTADNLAAKLGL